MKTDNKKIKILFRHRSMEMGGVEKVMLSLLNNLDREKFEMTVLLSLNQGELRDEIPAHVRKVFLADGKEDFYKNPLMQKIQLLKRKNKLEKLLKNPAKIDNEILKEKYDIEIAMTYNDFEPVLNSTNKDSKKIGWFHSEIQVLGLKPLLPMILEAFPKFDHMIYCSQRIHDLMHQHHNSLNFPAEQVITNAVPIDEIKEKSKAEIKDFPNSEVPVFISVGRLHYRKGYHKLIEAHSQLIKDGFPHKILIVGDGEHRKDLEKLIEQHNVQQSFHLLENKMNPYPYVRNSDFFILPSESEAWPLVIAEALILQKPVIATDTGDVAKMLRNKETGLLINYDIEEMYIAMKRFLTDKELVEQIKINLKNVEKDFDNRKIFNAVEDMLLKVMEQ